MQPPATSDAPAVSLSLREGRRSARTGATTYVLEVQNEGDGAVTVDLAAHLPAGEGIISLPDSVEVGGGGGTTITFEARPPKRRLRGSSRSTGFSVAATEPGGSPLSTATGEFDDTPVRWPIMAGGFLGGGALIAAVVGALLMATNVMSDDTPAPVSGNEEAVTGTPTSAQTPSATASDPGESATPQPRSGISRPRLEAPEPTEPLGFEILDGGQTYTFRWTAVAGAADYVIEFSECWVEGPSPDFVNATQCETDWVIRERAVAAGDSYSMLYERPHLEYWRTRWRVTARSDDVEAPSDPLSQGSADSEPSAWHYLIFLN